VALPENRDFGTLLESDAGQAFLNGAWGWYGLIVAFFLFNTVLGEELLFRGFLLPRMNGAFGRGDWVANGILFAGYHLHVPWVIPAGLLDTFILAYPTKRYRSAWIGIAVHSAQSVLIAVLVLTLVV
jgi:membrane protease YdiL (CAAX protease family)